MTVFVDITAAIMAVLNAAPAISDNVFRARDRAMAEEYSTAINVQVSDSTPFVVAINGAPIDWETTVTIECYAKSSTTSGDLAVDPILAAVFARVSANPSLNGTIGWIEPKGFKFEFDSQGHKTGWVGMTYSAHHRTSNMTLD